MCIPFHVHIILLFKGTRSSSSSEVTHLKRPGVDDVIKPHGPWQEYYDKRQKVYNVQLIAGVTVLVSTLLFVRSMFLTLIILSQLVISLLLFAILKC